MWAGVVFVLLAGAPACCRAAYSAYQYDEADANDNSADFDDSYDEEIQTFSEITTVVDAILRFKRYDERDVRTVNPREKHDLEGALNKILHGTASDSSHQPTPREYTDIYDYAERFRVLKQDGLSTNVDAQWGPTVQILYPEETTRYSQNDIKNEVLKLVPLNNEGSRPSSQVHYKHWDPSLAVKSLGSDEGARDFNKILPPESPVTEIHTQAQSPMSVQPLQVQRWSPTFDVQALSQPTLDIQYWGNVGTRQSDPKKSTTYSNEEMKKDIQNMMPSERIDKQRSRVAYSTIQYWSAVEENTTSAEMTTNTPFKDNYTYYNNTNDGNTNYNNTNDGNTNYNSSNYDYVTGPVKEILRTEQSNGDKEATVRKTTTTTTVPTTTTTVTTTSTTTVTTTKKWQIDINAIIAIIANLTYDYEWNLTEEFNKTLIEKGVPLCPTPTPITTTSTTPAPYDFANTTVVGKCFVCGLKTSEVPRHAHCADAFAGDFLPLMPVDARARGQIATYRKYCRRLDVHNFVENPAEPRAIYGRFTGGCAVRWIDLSGIYTQRTCRARFRPLMGKHFVSKRMAKLELALITVENGCIISPMASLVPFSRGVSLYARFHACVCTGNWCNSVIHAQASSYTTILVYLLAQTLSRIGDKGGIGIKIF